MMSDVCLSDVCLSVCLSVAYIGRKSRTERPRKTKIGTEVAHVTRDSDTTFNIKMSMVKVTRPLCSPPCWCVMRVKRWAWEHVGSGKLLLRCRLLGGARRFGAGGGGEGQGHRVAAARLQPVIIKHLYKRSNLGRRRWQDRCLRRTGCWRWWRIFRCPRAWRPGCEPEPVPHRSSAEPANEPSVSTVFQTAPYLCICLHRTGMSSAIRLFRVILQSFSCFLGDFHKFKFKHRLKCTKVVETVKSPL